MPAGLQVFSQAGNKIFDSEWGHARILGVINATTANGSFTVTTTDGSQLGTLFAYRTPFIAIVLGFYESDIQDEVLCQGNVITWKGLTQLPVKIVYGDAYK